MRAGTLIVDIAANVARLQADMTQARGVVSGAMNDITRSVNVAKSALGALGLGLSLGYLTQMAAGIVKSTAAFDDMAEATGASVEKLSRLSAVARVHGADMNTVQDGLVRLTRGLKGTEEETQNATAALAALGIQSKTAAGQLRDPGELMQEIAVKLDTFRDGAGKTAIALDLFGKSGAKLLPYLKDLATAGEYGGHVTAQQAAEAEKLENNLRRMTVAAEEAKREIMIGFTPALVDFTEKLMDAHKAAGNLATALLLVAAGGRSLPDVEKEIADREASLANRGFFGNALGVATRIGSLGTTSTGTDLDDQMALSLLRRQRDYLLLRQTRRMGELGAGLAEDPSGNVGPAPAKGALNYTGRTDLNKERAAAAKAAKAALDALNKTLENNAKSEDALTKARQEGAAVEAAASLKRGEALIAGYAAAQQIEFETKLIGLSNEEREVAIALRDLETKGIRETDDAYKGLAERMRSAISGKVAAEESKKASEAAAKEWESTFERRSDNLTRTVSDGLMRGFEKGAKSGAEVVIDTLKNALRTAVFEPVINAIISPVSRAITGATMGAGGSGFSIDPTSLLNFGGGGLEFASGFASTAFSSSAASAALIESGTVGFAGAGMEAGAGILAGGAASVIPYVGAALLAAQALGLFDEGGGPKPSQLGVLRNSAGQFWVSQNDVPGGAANVAGYNAAIPWGDLNDPTKYDPARLAGLTGYLQGAPGESAESMLQKLLAHIAPAAQAAQEAAQQTAEQTLAVEQEQLKAQQALLDRQPQLEASIAGAVRDLPQQLGISSLEAARMSLATSEDVAPLSRFAAARGYLTAGFGRAIGGDLSAVQSFPELLQSALGIGRDVFASGPQFASLKSESERMLDELLARQRGVQAEITASVPMTIKEAAADQIAELRRGFKAMVDELRANNDEIARLGALIAQ